MQHMLSDTSKLANSRYIVLADTTCSRTNTFGSRNLAYTTCEEKSKHQLPHHQQFFQQCSMHHNNPMMAIVVTLITLRATLTRTPNRTACGECCNSPTRCYFTSKVSTPRGGEGLVDLGGAWTVHGCNIDDGSRFVQTCTVPSCVFALG